MVSKIALADVDNDGNLDVVGIGETDPSLLEGDETPAYFVFTGRGNGSINTASTTAIGAGGAVALTMYDVNNDGRLDLVTIEGSNVAVRLGSGNGQFGAATSYAHGISDTIGGIEIRDINSDGFADFVIAGTSGSEGIVTVRLGSGNGTFSSTLSSYVTESGGSLDLKLVDMNGDGFLDLVTAGFNSGASEAILSVRLGVGNGTFSSAQTTLIFDTSLQGGVSVAGLTSIALGDLNGDGVVDVLAAGLIDPGGESKATSTTLLSITEQGVGPLISFSLKSKADALQAMGPLDNALANLAKQRGVIGAYQSRIDTALSTLSSARDNFAAARSRIRDADIASESSRLVRTQILQQAGAAVLAQANQQPALVLQLLRE